MLFLSTTSSILFALDDTRNNHTEIWGILVDQDQKLPLSGANVILFKKEDSLQIAGASTDEHGIFILPKIETGDYFLEFSFMGFKTTNSRIFSIKSGEHNKNLGVFTLKESSLLSNAISIVAERPIFVNSIDRKTYNVEKDIISQSGSASDLLQNIPSVAVDVNGQISLRGTANVTIFINGKPSLLMHKNSAVALQQMPANSIERIEVITNPSAKYKPDGVGGIINIVLKKKSQPGFNGTLIANAGNRERYNANITLNYNPQRLNLFGSYGLRHTNNPRVSTDSRIQKYSSGRIIGYYDDNSRSTVKPLAHIANMGLEYSIDKKNRMSMSGDFFYQNSYHTQFSQTTFRDADQKITTDFTTDRTNDEYEKEWEMSSSYEHDFNEEDHTLQFEFNYSGYNEQEDNHYNEIYSLPALAREVRQNLIRKGGYLAEFYAQYAYPVDEETQVEAGYVGEFLFDDIRYTGRDYNIQQNIWITDYNKTNRFLFNRDIHAIYATVGHSIENFSFLAGLRAEEALIASNLVTADTTIPSNYFKLYPTLHLAYDLSKRQQLQLNYSHRVRRADSDEHNPFAEYTDPRNMEAGNPKIKPEQVHSVEFGFNLQTDHFSVLPSIYYRYKYDAFTEIRRMVNDSTLLRYYTNLSNDQSAGLELIASAEIKNFLSLNFSANTFYYVIDASNLGYSSRKSTISLNAKLAANVELWESNLMQINAYYRSVRLTPQGETKPLVLLNVGMRQELFHKKASLTLTISDVFNSLKRTRRIDTTVLYQNAVSKRNSQIIYLGFTYRFGNSGRKEHVSFKFEDKI